MPKRITVHLDGDAVKATPRALRIQRTQDAVARQMKIAKAFAYTGRVIDEPGRLRKRHATNCGKTGCSMCGNPRHNSISAGTTNLTVQEMTFLDIQKEGLLEVQEGTGLVTPSAQTT